MSPRVGKQKYKYRMSLPRDPTLNRTPPTLTSPPSHSKPPHPQPPSYKKYSAAISLPCYNPYTGRPPDTDLLLRSLRPTV